MKLSAYYMELLQGWMAKGRPRVPRGRDDFLIGVDLDPRPVK
jgi:hypothetical protein